MTASSRSTLPPPYQPTDRMLLDDIPSFDFEQAKNLVRTSLVGITEKKEGGVTKRDVSLYAEHRSPFGAQYLEITAEDILWKWQEMRAKGGDGYDGVFKTWVGSRVSYHFWNDARNDFCDNNHQARVDFPIPLTEGEANWLSEAFGLRQTTDTCRTLASKEEKKFHYRFALNQSQISTYIGRMAAHYKKDPGSLSENRFKELRKAIEQLEPPSHFWLGVGIFVLGGIGVTGATALGVGVAKLLPAIISGIKQGIKRFALPAITGLGAGAFLMTAFSGDVYAASGKKFAETLFFRYLLSIYSVEAQSHP